MLARERCGGASLGREQQRGVEASAERERGEMAVAGARAAWAASGYNIAASCMVLATSPASWATAVRASVKSPQASPAISASGTA